MMLKKLGVPVVVAIFVLSSITAWGLAPGNPDIYVQSAPASQDVAAGGSAVFTISIISQEGFEDQVQLSVTNPPAGVKVTFDPNPVNVPAYAQGDVKMTVAADSSATAGAVKLSVVSQGVTKKDIKQTTQVTVNIGSGGGGQPVKTSTSTTSTSSTTSTTSTTVANATNPVSTTTVLSTTSVVSTVTQTTTEVITTRTSAINTKTTVSGFAQASDLTLPVAALVIVVALLAVAAFALRRR
ncbi:MAG: hypothetical protein M1503_06265 [Thaumarchaeota archaeon]|nr:hypothetical protein [Nitrososphaerota archaeon]MCL5317847.1 hypothetical protein [Nitrososphaerota archaeon]